MSLATIHRKGQVYRQLDAALPAVETRAGTVVWQPDSVTLLGPEGQEVQRYQAPPDLAPEKLHASPDGRTILLQEDDRLVSIGSVSRELEARHFAFLGGGGAVLTTSDHVVVLDARLEEVARHPLDGPGKLQALADGEVAVLSHDKIQVIGPEGELVHETTGRAPSYRTSLAPDGSALYFCEEMRAASWFGGGWSMGSSLMRYRPGQGVERLGSEARAEPLPDGSYLEVSERSVVHRASSRSLLSTRLSFGYREYLDRVKVAPGGKAALISTRGEGERKLYRMDLTEPGSRPQEIHRATELFEAWFTPTGEVTFEKPPEPVDRIEFPVAGEPPPALEPRGQVHFLLQDSLTMAAGAVLSDRLEAEGQTVELPEGDRVTAAVSLQAGQDWILAAGTAQGRVFVWDPPSQPREFSLQAPVTGFAAVGNQLAAASAGGELLLLDTGVPVRLADEGGQTVGESPEAVIVGGVRVPKR